MARYLRLQLELPSGYLTLRRLSFLTLGLAYPDLVALPSSRWIYDLGSLISSVSSARTWFVVRSSPSPGPGCHPWLSSPICPFFVGLKSEFSALLGGFCQQTSSTCSARLYRQALGRSQSRHCYKQGASRADATLETVGQERPLPTSC